MTYAYEFPDMPAADMPDLPAGWFDTSWHNDACPSYTSPDGVVIWIDYADPDRREFDGHGRFSITYLDLDGCHMDGTTMLDFETFDAALAHAALGNVGIASLLADTHKAEFEFWLSQNYDDTIARTMADTAVERERAKAAKMSMILSLSWPAPR